MLTFEKKKLKKIYLRLSYDYTFKAVANFYEAKKEKI